MGILSRIFGKPRAADRIVLIRHVIGREVVRGDETFDCNSISDEILIGLPEATVITVIAMYFDLKYLYCNLTEKEIFRRILHERLFSDPLIDKILGEKIDLFRLIKLSLEHKELGDSEDQSGYLSDAQILAFIEKYKEMAKL